MNNRSMKDDKTNHQMYMDNWDGVPSYQMYGGAFYDQEYQQVPPNYSTYPKKGASPQTSSSSNLFYTQGSVDWSYNDVPPQTMYSGGYSQKFYPQGNQLFLQASAQRTLLLKFGWSKIEVKLVKLFPQNFVFNKILQFNSFDNS
jgi:hypothetical protein